MLRRSLIFYIALTLALTNPSGVTPAPLQATEISSAKITAHAEKLRNAFLARKGMQYRLATFDALVAVRRASSAELETALTVLADSIVRRGPDGVEPLLLAVTDRIATRSSVAVRRRAGKTLRKVAPSYRYRDTIPAPNMKVPIARGGGLSFPKIPSN